MRSKGTQYTVYVKRELLDRIENLKGRKVALDRVDVEGKPYKELAHVPDTNAALTRFALEHLADMAEEAHEREEHDHA